MRISDWSSDVCSSDLVLDRLALRMEHVEPFRPLLGLVDHAGDTSKLTRQADIEPEAGSPQSRSQPRARARRPAGEQITVCLGPLKKLIPESSVEGIPVAIGIVIVFQLACRNALLPFGQALPRLLEFGRASCRAKVCQNV